MREQLEELQRWLDANRDDTAGHAALRALAGETLKRVDSEDTAQREFDAYDLAQAARYENGSDFASSKRWLERAKLETYAEARRNAIEEHFRSQGHSLAIAPSKRSPGGKHRAVWFLKTYEIADPQQSEAGDQLAAIGDRAQPVTIQYEFTPPGEVRPSWIVKPLIGTGSFITRSWRGLVWVAAILVPLTYILLTVLVALLYTRLQRPLQTSELSSIVVMGVLVWVVWRFFLRPTLWLLDDRIIPASEVWVAWSEEAGQLELAKDKANKRRLQLVRYSAVCPVCAGTIELRYSQGSNRRQLVGCCNEAPHDHVFSFDRVLRVGHRQLAPSLTR